MNEIFPTIYWFCQPLYKDVHNILSNPGIYVKCFSQEKHMTDMDKWWICLN